MATLAYPSHYDVQRVKPNLNLHMPQKVIGKWDTQPFAGDECPSPIGNLSPLLFSHRYAPRKIVSTTCKGLAWRCVSRVLPTVR